MARKRRSKKKKQKPGFSQQVMLVLTGAALMLCALSIMYGFLIRQSVAENNLKGLRIEILNGIGEKGLARDIATALMKKGVDVFNVDNAENFSYDESILIARRKNDRVKALGRALGCDNVIVQLQEDSFVDATFIIGADYDRLKLGD